MQFSFPGYYVSLREMTYKVCGLKSHLVQKHEKRPQFSGLFLVPKAGLEPARL